MDLFIVNRYRDTNEDTDLVTQETKHLQKLKQKIEERKKSYGVNKKSDDIILKHQPEEKEIITTQYHDIEKSTELNIVEEQINDERVTKNSTTTVKTKDESHKPSVEFKILGVNNFEAKAKVKRVLPYWLSHSFNISTNLQKLSCSIESQHWLHGILKTTLLNEGITHLFPVQEQVIPFILKEYNLRHSFWPHDVCVSAPTGSGKTLSYVLPIIQILMDDIGHHVRALIVLPVQELASQVTKVFKKYCTGTGLKVALLSGSTPLRQEQQHLVKYTESTGWVSEVDIIICTAGRLVEHIQNTEGFSLKHLKFIVIDEADKIMDHIQNDWLYHLDRHIKLENELMTGKVTNLSWNNLNKQKPPPHKLLFSATLSQDPEKLDQWALFQPKLFSAAAINGYEDEDTIMKYTTPDELKEKFITCSAEEKPLVLFNFLVEQKLDKVLCFTNASQSAHRLAVLLDVWGKGKFKVSELSAALNRTRREAVLKKFTQSEINILIGTDALARGIDIPNCDYVISYDPPRNIKTYVHRVGRTGRAGRTGHAITFLLPNQVPLFKELLLSGGKYELPEINVDQNILYRLTESYECAIRETKKLIHTEIGMKVKKSISLKRTSKSKPQKRKHRDILNAI